MSSELIHDSDKHELEQWFEWKRQERAQRLQDCRRRKLLRAIRKDIRASKTTDVTRTSISKGVQPQLSKRYGLSHRFLDQSSEVNNESAENDSDDLEIEDDDDGAHYGNSEADSKRDAEDNTESETDWDASDDETPLMKLMSKFDYLQSLAAVDSLVQERQKHLNERLASRQTTTTMLFLPFSKTIVRIRQRKAIKETRHRLAQMRTLDGLPISLPLQTCGHWIQVINLQQETPFTQKVMSQPLAQYPANTASASALLSTQPYSIEHVLPEHQQNHQQHTNQQYQQQQQSNRQRIYRLLASFFNGPLRQASLDNYGELSSDLPLQQKKMSSRLESRRDFVTSKTLQTILDNCPGLCRLTLSGCQGVTDHGLGLIKQAACVRNSTLVWLHMAGCVQITDQGLLNLVIQDFKNDSSISSESTPRFESLDFSGCFQITDQSLIPLIRQCGTKLTQLKLADCKSISSECIMILTQHCPRIRWLDLGQSGGEDMLAEECLIQLAIFCPGLEWLNLSRSPPELNFDGSGGHAETEGEMRKNHGIGGFGANNWDCTQRRDANLETQQDHTRLVSDYAVAKLCQYCTKLQLLDLSYILTITDSAIESLSKTARSLVCLTIIGCPGITSRSLSFLAKLRNTNRKLSCITMGDAQGISEKDIEQVMQVALSGWQKSLVDDIHMTDILGHSWED
ncbi:hypothetical protein BX616_000021 [Lobosporangium transversale]|nr:hypothetical protein BX616_000021 [Lobosporangium transversale]